MRGKARGWRCRHCDGWPTPPLPNAEPSVLLPTHDFCSAPHPLSTASCAGLVGMIRNWTFTLFFCMSELWGDVCLGLLFWGLANDTTSISEAPVMYPLFGLGANLAQVRMDGRPGGRGYTARNSAPYQKMDWQLLRGAAAACPGSVVGVSNCAFYMNGNESVLTCTAGVRGNGAQVCQRWQAR